MSPKMLNIGFITPLTSAESLRQFFFCVEAMCSLGHAWHLLATGNAQAQKQCFRMQEIFPKQFFLYEAIPQNKNKILAKTDVCFFLKSPQKKDLDMLRKNNSIPIGPQNNQLNNYDPIKETGDAFTYTPKNHWQMLYAIIRAEQNFQFPYDWRQIVNRFQSEKKLQTISKKVAIKA